MYSIIKPLLFSLPPETAHHLTFRLLKLAGTALIRGIYQSDQKKTLQKKVFGFDFRNPVGLAAGLDKNALAFNELGALGFGFIEVGTVTPKPQPGNPVPRLFRLTRDQALLNRMGFNNDGVKAVAARLAKRKDPTLIIGGNIGKNKDTPVENAALDYVACFEALDGLVDYFVVNVSSPNTPGLRSLQEKEPLTKLIESVQKANLKKQNPSPVLLKIAPELDEPSLDDIIQIVKNTGLAGIIATNTTVSRAGLSYSAAELEQFGTGGISGKPLRTKSTAVLHYLHQKSEGSIPLIASGGIHNPGDAIEKIQAGASLLQLYTGFVYEGPGLIGNILRYLDKDQMEAFH